MKKKLIDADALKEIISGNSYILRDSINSMNFGMFWDGIEQAIDEAPTIDAVPLRTGSWNEEKVGCTKIYICSCCGKKYYISPLNDNYCASCGALMKKEDRYEL